MKAMHGKSGFRAPGLLLGGLVAGAMGLAFSAGGPSPSERGPGAKDASGQYGLPSSDTGMTTVSPGTGSPSSTGLYGTGTGSASLPPNVSPGWKIRVCSEKTKADRIDFRFSPAGDKAGKAGAGAGTSGNKGSSGMGGSGSGSAGAPSAYPANDPSVNAALSDQGATWTRGEATEISLPTGLRDADRIRIEAAPSQKDQDASVCVIYNDHVAKKLMFDDREVSMVKSTDNGECGC